MMADGLCGPSNPLQNFQKRSSIDRSLQQDRFISRSKAPQGFRSHAGQNAGILDSEFEAFKAGVPTGLPDQQIPLHAQHHFLSPQVQPMSRPQHDAAWATDFQRLAVSQPQIQQSIHQPPQQQSPSNWHQDFQRHQSPAFTQAPQTTFQSTPNFSSYHPMFQSQSYGQPMYDQNQGFDKGKGRLVESQVDAAAFELAFEAHAHELQQVRGVDAHGMDSTQEKLDAVNSGAASIYKNYQDMQYQSDWNATAQDAMNREEKGAEPLRASTALEEIHGELARQDAQREQQSQDRADSQRQEDDDLAATAGELLNRVSGNRSQKFKDSTFLAFMERIRDRQVKVEGDQFVDVNDAAQPQDVAPQPASTYMAGALSPDEMRPESSRSSGGEPNILGKKLPCPRSDFDPPFF